MAHNKKSIREFCNRQSRLLHGHELGEAPERRRNNTQQRENPSDNTNAREFKEIKKECGSFQKYLDNLDKSDKSLKRCKDLSGKFKWLGPSSASLFLYTVGEKISHIGINLTFLLFFPKSSILN